MGAIVCMHASLIYAKLQENPRIRPLPTCRSGPVTQPSSSREGAPEHSPSDTDADSPPGAVFAPNDVVGLALLQNPRKPFTSEMKHLKVKRSALEPCFGLCLSFTIRIIIIDHKLL